MRARSKHSSTPSCRIPVVSTPLRELSRLNLANVFLLPFDSGAWATQVCALLAGYRFDQPLKDLTRFHWQTLAREVEAFWQQIR